MTAERYRLPVGKAARALAYDGEPATARDLFPAPAGDVHPDFAARAAIWRDQAAGVISIAEAQRRSSNIGRAVTAKVERRAAPPSPRHLRPAPNESRQYAGAMATTACRDDRLVPQAKALLQVLRARCGKGRETKTTKTTLAAVMSRSTRSIARYLRDLEACGYIATRIRSTGCGLHLGLVVTITEKTVPFYETAGALASWLASTPEALSHSFAGRVLSGKAGMTSLSPKNQTSNISILKSLRHVFRREAEGAVAAPS